MAGTINNMIGKISIKENHLLFTALFSGIESLFGVGDFLFIFVMPGRDTAFYVFLIWGVKTDTGTLCVLFGQFCTMGDIDLSFVSRNSRSARHG